MQTPVWPRLDAPALVGAALFGTGVSARLVVEAAQRQAAARDPSAGAGGYATGSDLLRLLAVQQRLATEYAEALVARDQGRRTGSRLSDATDEPTSPEKFAEAVAYLDWQRHRERARSGDPNDLLKG